MPPLSPSNALPVARVTSSVCLSDERGNPVWGVVSDEDLEGLEAYAQLVGAELVWTQTAEPSSGAPQHLPALWGPVVSLGDAPLVVAAARLYAHLTGREFLICEEVSELPSTAEVVVTDSRGLNPSLVSNIYSCGRRKSVPGIICAESTDLHAKVLQAAAALRLPEPAPCNHVCVFSDEELEQTELSGARVFGARADLRDVRDALARGAELVTITGHSDGIDACLLPGRLTLCPMARVDESADPLRAPYCRVTGQCARHDGSVESICGSEEVLHPHQLRARVLVLASCFGVLADEGPVDPRWGFLQQLLSNSKIGAIVTSWSTTDASRIFLTPFEASLEKGASLGEAVATGNRACLESDAPGSDTVFCLLGDPRMRVGLRSAGALAEIFADVPRYGQVPADTQTLRELAFARGYMQLLRVRALSSGASAITEAIDEALEALGLYEFVKWMGAPLDVCETDPGQVFRDALLRVVELTATAPWGDWSPLSAGRIAHEHSACDHCGLRAGTVVSQLRVHPDARRRVRTCPACLVTEDAPVESELSFRICGADAFELVGELPHQDWTAMLLIKNEMGLRESQTYPWPAGDDGRPVPSYSPPGEPPPGQLTVFFLLVAGCSIQSYGLRIHRESLRVGLPVAYHGTGSRAKSAQRTIPCSR